MRKLFQGIQRDKPKDQLPQPPPPQQTPQGTPIHQQFASARPSVDGEQWDIIDQNSPPLLPGASPSVPSPTRSPSPYSVPSNKQPPSRKKTPPALGILSSLDPMQPPNRSDERSSDNGHVLREKDKDKSKGSFWGRGGNDRDRDRVDLEREVRERERGRERRDEENELTRKIGFLTATASEDWTLVLDVCDHASANDANAKEAVRALRREFKYGEPAAQLAAARLWAIMLRNSSDTFISQSTSRKFLDTLEDLLSSTRTSPVVRERVMDVLAAAAYASGSKKDTGFRGLWRRVKPRDKPEEGVPFDTEDAMFNPPISGIRVPAYEYDNNINGPVAPIVTYQDATPIEPEMPRIIAKPPPRRRKTSDNNRPSGDKQTRDHHRDRHRIIPPEEDMRRLFQECKMGLGNANLLSEALAMATPDDLGSAVITEFHKKCMASQELIFTQIPWASAGAERSRAARDQQEEKERERKRNNSENTLNPANLHGNDSLPDLAAPASTREEDLFGELLIANEQLLEALKLYDDLKRVAIEREAEDRSRKEVRLDPRERQYLMDDGMLHSDITGGGGSSSRSRSASPARAPVQHTPPNHPQNVDIFPLTQPQQSLAPPPAAPHGPRLPGVSLSRTPSPGHPDAGAGAELANGLGAMRVGGANVYTREHAATNGRGSFDTNGRASIDERREAYSEDDVDERAMQPSAKALGKRKVDPLDHGQSGDEMPMGPKDSLDDRLTDSDDDEDSPLGLRHRSVQHYVYDAVAERMQQRLRDGHQLLVNGVH